MNADRALSAFTDVLAVEWDDEAGMARIVTISDVYHAVPSEGLHTCPDREYNEVDLCKHVFAAEITRGRFDAPTGWMVTDDLDERTEPTFDLETDADETAETIATDGGSVPEFEPGDRVEDQDTDDEGTMIVLDADAGRADSVTVPKTGETVAESDGNEAYADDDRVVRCAFVSWLDTHVPHWYQVDGDELAEWLVQYANEWGVPLQVYSYPESRLQSEGNGEPECACKGGDDLECWHCYNSEAKA